MSSRTRNRGSDSGSHTGKLGITYVRCRVCGDHRRVISGRHLSKHEIDRETYLEEYRLSPDELIAKEFRVIQSSRLVPSYELIPANVNRKNTSRLPLSLLVSVHRGASV